MTDLNLSPTEIHKLNKQLKKQNKNAELIKLNKESPYFPFYNFINDLEVSKVCDIDYLYSVRLLLFINYLKECNDEKYNKKQVSDLYNNKQDDIIQELMDKNGFVKIPIVNKINMVK